MMYSVREALPADSEQVVDVLRRSITEVCGPDYDDPEVIDDWLSNKTEANIHRWIVSASTYSVVCEDDAGVIMGFALTTHEGEIMLCYLLPEALHLGNGRRMLWALEDFLCARGRTQVRTTSTITARAFYQRNGFVSDGAPIKVGNIDGDFPLVKQLTPSGR